MSKTSYIHCKRDFKTFSCNFFCIDNGLFQIKRIFFLLFENLLFLFYYAINFSIFKPVDFTLLQNKHFWNSNSFRKFEIIFKSFKNNLLKNTSIICDSLFDPCFFTNMLSNASYFNVKANSVLISFFFYCRSKSKLLRLVFKNISGVYKRLIKGKQKDKEKIGLYYVIINMSKIPKLSLYFCVAWKLVNWISLLHVSKK